MSKAKRNGAPARVVALVLVLSAIIGFWLRLPAFWRWLSGALITMLVIALVGRWLFRHAPQRLLLRLRRRSQRHDGLASRWDVLFRSGWLGVRWRAKVLRPSLRDVSLWRRWRVPITELAFRLVTVGRLALYSTVEEVTLRVAPPRSGKTAELANQIISAPGAAVVASTKIDVFTHTVGLRRRTWVPRGRWAQLLERAGVLTPRTGPLRPVYVFSPDEPDIINRPELQTNVRWNPLLGCERPEAASQLAGYLLAGSPAMSGVGDRSFWEAQSKSVLAALIHAAALGGLTMLTVLHWVSDVDRSAREVLGWLDRSPEAATWTDEYRHFVDTNPNTRSSITRGVTPALDWLRHPVMARVVTGSIGEQFDVGMFLAQRGTLYLLAAEQQHGSLAPFNAAFTAHIFETAKSISAGCPGERLDPPLTIVLDEAPLICPVPLERWTADAGGRGIALHIAIQAIGQLEWKWGKAAADIIWGNANVKLILAGISNVSDLEMLSTLAGERLEPVITRNDEGKVIARSSRWVPVLKPADISTLARWRALVLRGGMRVTIGRIKPVWKRKDVKAAKWADLPADQRRWLPRWLGLSWLRLPRLRRRRVLAETPVSPAVTMRERNPAV